MKYNRCLVTVTDVIGPTSMPFNEFVLYRLEHYKNEKQIILLLFKNAVSSNIEIPSDIEIHCIGKNIGLLKSTVQSIYKNCLENNMDIIFHIHEAKSVVFFDAATGGKFKDKLIYTLHSTYKNYKARTKILCRMASKRCKTIVCVSDTSYKYYPEKLKRKYSVVSIQNGVSTERIDCIYNNMQLTVNSQFQIAYVARLVALKRHDMLLRIIAKIPEVKLNIIGNGPLMDELKDKAKALGIDNRVNFTGSMPRDEVYKKLLNMDLYVSTSSYEGLPVSVLEAMSCGVPCLVSDIEQHREISKKCPSLVIASDEADWVEKINSFINMTTEKRKKIGSSCRVETNIAFSLESMHSKYNKAYGENFE